MFSLNSMSTIPPTKVLSAYTTFMAIIMVIRTMVHEIQSMTKQLIPPYLQQKIISILGRIFTINVSSKMTLVIDEADNGGSINDMYHASELYLRNRIPPSIDRLKVSKSPKDKTFSFTVGPGEKIIDEFQGIQLTWKLVISKTRKSPTSNSESEQRSFELCFHKEHQEKVVDSYLRHIIEKSEEKKRENKVMKLYSLGKGGVNQSTKLDHPSTFDTLAMDPSLKQRLKDDLNRFVERRDFYRKVGKAWKRGYLLYGPPGTGKSSLIAAMANHLKFDIYDLELTSVKCNLDLRKLLLSTKNRSILVIEDIDCSTEFQDRQHEGPNNSDCSQVTLSGLLNFNDGLWSSCGDERIIVFTTNHKDRLDPALLRPGRMDMHIHMTYCTFDGFKILVSNYLTPAIKSHDSLFHEIEQLIMEVNVTPAEIAEELMRSDNNAEIALREIIQLLQKKKVQLQHGESNAEAGKGVRELGKENQEIEEAG